MSWYIVSTPRHQERLVKQSLDAWRIAGSLAQENGGENAPSFNTFLPLRNESTTDVETGQLRVVHAPVIPGLVFVQTTLPLLRQWLSEVSMGSKLYTDINERPIIVPEYQIRLFKDYLSFVGQDVMVLRKPYSYFLKKKKIRILSGKFAGLEGRLFQIKGNYKLVYGLGNTALALSDIAKNPYVEITDEEPARIRYTFYYDKMQEELEALLAEGMGDNELFRCLNRWRQEASVLTQESPVASSYVSLALQQSLSDLYVRHRALFDERATLRIVKSIYQDTEDYLSLTCTLIDEASVLQQVQQRRVKIQARKFYAADPLGLKQEEGPATTYGFLREQEASFAEVIQLLGDESDTRLESRKKAFRLLVVLFQTIARKLQQCGYREHLDSLANYRLRKLLGMAARQYRRCKEGQDAAFVRQHQTTLLSLLAHDIYHPHGFFDLLSAIRHTPKPSSE